MSRTTTHIVPKVLTLGLTLLLAACGASTEAASVAAGGGSAPAASEAADESTAPASAATDSAPAEAQIDLSSVDACSMLDTATIRQLTGASADVDYATDSFQPTHCFWGATVPGESGYVELDLIRQTGLANYTFRNGACPAAAIAGVGAEAEGGTCPPDPQTKVYLLAFEGGVIVSLVVNEGVATPEDLAPIAESVLARLR